MSRELSTFVTAGKRAFAENDLARAEKVLREAIEGGANYADIHYMLGQISHRRGKLRQAVEHFETSVAINPAYTEALLSLSITLSDLGRYDEARSAYQRASQTVAAQGAPAEGNLFRGRVANLHAELGELYRALGQHEDAIEEYRKAIRVAPGFPDLRLRLAAALRDAGRIREGLSEIERVITDRPDLLTAHLQHGILLYLSGDREKARRAWEDALFRDPTNKLVQFYLNTLDRETAG
ncbi:MAG: tetratricopeptide repeat protein [Deltaproteobacteria bacterium]|nr:tetratricopeptide repeat protein [Deltaproteobacteria bacterium]